MNAASLLLLTLGLAATPAAAGIFKQFTYHSAALGSDQTTDIYVPSSEPPAEGWPVLYLLHGLHGRPDDFESMGQIRETLDRLIESKQIKPLMVVMPEGADSWYVDSAEVGGPGNYASAIAHDLPAAIERSFPVATDRLHRAVAGISMGGYGALRLALAEPERYAAVAALSPAIWQNVPLPVSDDTDQDDKRTPQPYFLKRDPNTVTIGVDLPPNKRHFGAVFGTPFDPQRFNAANVFTLLQQAVAAKKPLPAVYVTCGDDDSHLLWRGSIAFFETMQLNKRWIEFRVTDGDHNWALWKTSLVDAILFVDRVIDKVPTR